MVELGCSLREKAREESEEGGSSGEGGRSGLCRDRGWGWARPGGGAGGGAPGSAGSGTPALWDR